MRKGQTVGDALAVVWFDIAEPDPEYEVLDDPRSVFNQGFGQGAAKFNRLEGCWYDDGSVFFVSTAAATRRTATSTRTATGRGSARSGSTGRARATRAA